MRPIAAFFAALLLSIAPSWAQLTATGVGGGDFGGVGPSYTGVFDVSGHQWTDYWALRAGSAAIAAAGTQPLVRLTATGASPTNAGCDVLVATNGGLGLTANCDNTGDNGHSITTFCTQGGGACHNKVVYDQGSSATSVTDARQHFTSPTNDPTFTLSCLGSFSCMTTTSGTGAGTARFLSMNLAAQAQTTPFTFFGVAQATSITTFKSILGAQGGVIIGYNTGPNAALWAGSNINKPIASGTAWHALSSTFNGASTGFNVDGTDYTVNPGTYGFGTSFWNVDLGGSGNGAAIFDGNILEVGNDIYTYNSTQRTAICTNQNAYWGLSLPC